MGIAMLKFVKDGDEMRNEEYTYWDGLSMLGYYNPKTVRLVSKRDRSKMIVKDSDGRFYLLRLEGSKDSDVFNIHQDAYIPSEADLYDKYNLEDGSLYKEVDRSRSTLFTLLDILIPRMAKRPTHQFVIESDDKEIKLFPSENPDIKGILISKYGAIPKEATLGDILELYALQMTLTLKEYVGKRDLVKEWSPEDREAVSAILYGTSKK